MEGLYYSVRYRHEQRIHWNLAEATRNRADEREDVRSVGPAEQREAGDPTAHKRQRHQENGMGRASHIVMVLRACPVFPQRKSRCAQASSEKFFLPADFSCSVGADLVKESRVDLRLTVLITDG